LSVMRDRAKREGLLRRKRGPGELSVMRDRAKREGLWLGRGDGWQELAAMEFLFYCCLPP
jgi:hypothetical protein